ncbi:MULTISPECIES: hypothetical protein [unclassified Rummeliibacillus]|uniref:hypothetical protein n=1 Tax=unclassified Rummeliibacillus TaxID=2622809 RepID=UPI000E6684A6|nr:MULTISPECIES: hypothetical protein [unclassified Rummeliibacillus]RIJ64443.1 hypothetical protein D1606_10425 [Rummeliibacillus sp. POC4]RPJ95065.1 hypothetical protein CW357_12350 [Rummeliibacillus sp. TYF005]
MTTTLLMSAIIAVIAAVLIMPITSRTADGEFKTKFKMQFGIAIFILAFIITVIVFYVTKIDQNWTILWPVLFIISLIGALLSNQLERKIKGIIAFASLLFVVYLISAPFFNANQKYQSAEMTKKVEIEAFDDTKTPASVPPKFARNKMKKAFSQVPNTSYYELGNLQIQKVNGEYVYIAPVEFSDFFKWMKGKESPGYLTMSATNSSDNPKFVKSPMVYTTSAYLNNNVERHMRLANTKEIFYGDAQLEVNDDGKPFYIRTYGEFISGRNGFDPKGIVMIDAKTGKSQTYALKDVPEFIDGAISPEAVSRQNEYFGKYVHGYWNSLFGKKDVKLPSDEGTEANVSPVFDENGTMYYFTDFTSPKEGVDSMLGYSLTNARTGQATYYSGNKDEAYMDSQGAIQIIEKKFIEKKWQASMPIIYNFYGEASWLVPVLDSNGFLQNYSIVSAANPELSVSAATPNEALRQYKTVINRSGSSSLNSSSSSEEKIAKGKVIRVYKEKNGDYTTISFLLDNKENYIVSSELAPLAVYLKEGDQVEVKYVNSTDVFLPVKEMTIQGIEE